MPQYFIASPGTENGKTFITCGLGALVKKLRTDFHSIKPVLSGFTEGTNDAILIAESLNLTSNEIFSISPWIFTNPVAPYFAAEMEKKTIDYHAILKFCEKNLKQYSNLLIESTGGIMSPITRRKLCIDLAMDLELPIVFVTGSYLGTISHSLMAIESILRRNMKIKCIIVNQTLDTMPTTTQPADFITSYTGITVFELKNTVSTNCYSIEIFTKLMDFLEF